MQTSISSPILRSQSANTMHSVPSINSLVEEPTRRTLKVNDEPLCIPLNERAILFSKLVGSNNRVSMPSYDRSAVTAGILHVGVGNFHRSHQATYMDDLFHLDFANNKQWGIVGGGIMSFDADKRSLLKSQDWLQTLVEQDGETEKARVIGSMIDFVPVDPDGARLLDAMTNPNIKIVSLTVTEGGYFLNNGKFDAQHPLIQHDIAHPDQPPKTVFGMMIKALRLRRHSGHSPFTVLSCDNIPHNGAVCKSVLLGLASAIDSGFAQWMEENVACPNSMVDRITPATTNEQRQHVREKLGCGDAAPIFCEPFRQWVLEDNFPQGRPNLELLENVSFVSDVSPYEHMKIRILNGGHASLCYPSALLGIRYVHEAMEHPTIAAFLDALERNEIIPTVGPVPGTCLQDYLHLIAKRFSNPSINDTITRVCFGGASNQPKFIIPVVADNSKESRSVDGLALVSAMWCRYCQGKTETGEDIAPNDPQWDRLHAIAMQANTNPLVWLQMTDIYGEVGLNSVFIKAFSDAMKTIQNEGVEIAMKKYVEK